MSLWAILKNSTFQVKNGVASFLVNFGKKWASFYINIGSHWLMLLTLENALNCILSERSVTFYQQQLNCGSIFNWCRNVFVSSHGKFEHYFTITTAKAFFADDLHADVSIFQLD